MGHPAPRFERGSSSLAFWSWGCCRRFRFRFPVFLDYSASILYVLGDAAALLGVQHVTFFVGEQELVVTGESMLDMIESDCVISFFLKRSNADLGAILLKVFGQLDRLIAG